MIYIISVVVLFAKAVLALPRPDSAVGDEIAVSAPNGIILSDTAVLAAQTASQTWSQSVTAYAAAMTGSWASAEGSPNTQDDGSIPYDSYSSFTWIAVATSTAAAASAYSAPSYGSGSSSWGSGYNDCVNQCVAKFGAPMASYAPTATYAYGNTDNAGLASGSSGATHTVIVAPTQGVLRYIPFALNASVGDTIMFMWGANNHTVTKSSTLELCNNSAAPLFDSGENDQGFTFTQVVNDTNPTFFHCNTPTHCEKGMFGIINPPNAFASPSSVSGMMHAIASTNTNISAYADITQNATTNNKQAASWGGNIDMSSMPAWSQTFVAENVLYTRNFLARNAEVLHSDGTIDLSSAGASPLIIPMDISAALLSVNTSNASSANSPGAAASPVVESSQSATAGNSPSSGSLVTSPRLWASFISLFVTTTFIL